MWEYEFTETECGVIGILPTGEEREFATEDEYYEAYREEEDQIYDFMAECSGEQEWPEDY